MHLRFNFDACPMHSPSGFVRLTHQNLSARALFCLNSLTKVNTQLLIYNCHIVWKCVSVTKSGKGPFILTFQCIAMLINRLLAAESHCSITAFQVKMNLIFMRHYSEVTLQFLCRRVQCGNAMQLLCIHTLRVHYAHVAANLNSGYSKYTKVACVHYFCTIALRTSRAVVTRAWASRRVGLRERRVDSFSKPICW